MRLLSPSRIHPETIRRQPCPAPAGWERAEPEASWDEPGGWKFYSYTVRGKHYHRKAAIGNGRKPSPFAEEWFEIIRPKGGTP